MSWRDLSIVHKLGLLLVLNTVLAVLMIAGVFTVGTAIARYQERGVQLLALAQVVGENSRAALAFNDAEGARQTLLALRMQEDVVTAQLYSADGKPFARADFGGRIESPWLFQLATVLLPQQVQAAYTLLDNGQAIGRIEVQAHLGQLWWSLLRHIAVMAFIGGCLAGLAVFYGVRLRRTVSDPILALKQVTRQVSVSQDYAIRAVKASNDEIGDLVDDFNRMLAEIQARDVELQRERKSMEQRTLEMKNARDEAERANRVKSEFLSTVSHELRTPLTAISGSLGLLLGGAVGELPPAIARLLQVAHKNGQRLAFLIDDLLDMEKLLSGKQSFAMLGQELMPLLEQALQVNQAYAEPLGVRLVLAERGDGAWVCVDAQRLQQVLANLLSNAAKFSPRGASVEVSVQHQGGRVRVSVADHGSGVPLDFQARIFEKFSQADASDTRQKGGTGLGLAITRELVERMGGQVGYASQPGQGACFHVDLPLWQLAMSPPGTRYPLAQSPPLRAPRMLVVEYGTDVARLLTLMLIRAGYQVDSVTHAAQALAMCEQHVYAAVTVDLMLPNMTGLDLIRVLRAQHATHKLPIVVVAACMQEERHAYVGDMANIEWLAKPIDQSRLLGALQRLIRGPSHAPTRVLHVEDDQTVHEMVCDMAGMGFNFEHATTLREARARMSLERFDVVLLDLSLPNESGWDRLPEIRRQQPGARVVILSSAELSATEAKHADAVLHKTMVTPRELMAAIDGRHWANDQPKEMP